MSDLFRYITVSQIDFAPRIERQRIDPLDRFAFLCLQMRTPALIPPLVVRPDRATGQYFVVTDGPVYEREGLVLEVARALGLSVVPCRILVDPAGASPSEASSPS